MATHILLINGPNLNLLGLREPHIYGTMSLPVLESLLEAHCKSLTPSVCLSCFQSNYEGAILDVIHSCHPERYTYDDERRNGTRGPRVDAIVINAGGLTHTSVVLRDALVGVGIPFVEVHITNVYARDAFRHSSFLSEKATAVISGLGVFGYKAAVDYLVSGSVMNE